MLLKIFICTICALNAYAVETKQDLEKSVNKNSGSLSWTCSMHPQIKVPEFGQCPLCFMDLIPLDQTKVLPSNIIEVEDKLIKSAGILTYPIQNKKDRKNLSLYGKVVLKPSNKFRVTAWAAGRVDKLFVSSVGEFVKKGEALYEIYSPVLISAHQELIQAINLVQKSDPKSSHFKSLSVNVQAIRQKLQFLGLSKSELKRLENTKDLIKHITIYAQRSGVIRHVALKEGEYVKEGESVLLIADMSELWVEASVYENDIQALKGSIQSLILLDSNPQDEIIAKLIRVDPFVNPITRASRAIFSINNSKGLFFEGGFARVQVVTNSQSGYLVPHSAPLFIGHNAVIFIRKANQFESKIVRIVEKTESYYRIIGNVEEGDEVVVKGTFKLDSEFQLQAKDSMMSTEQLINPYGSRLDLRRPIEKAKDWLAKYKADHQFIEFSKSLFDLYLELHLSLSEDSFDESKEILMELKSIIVQQDINKLSMPAQKVLGLFKLSLLKDLTALEDTIIFKDIRIVFDELSSWIITLMENNWVLRQENVIKFYCSMAFDSKGAFWVQEDEEILNPYFGSKMINCGTKLKWIQ
tara:strand:+ start:1935 stop:3677 length:1743 start_codon:yes stop_codon:yes gene_type:complete